jgi:hypothetical protein
VVNDMKNEEQVYKTKDLIVASYLRYKDVKLVSDYKKEIKSWVFNDPELCEKLSLDVKNGDAIVNPVSFESCRRSLLAMVNSSKK